VAGQPNNPGGDNAAGDGLPEWARIRADLDDEDSGPDVSTPPTMPAPVEAVAPTPVPTGNPAQPAGAPSRPAAANRPPIPVPLQAPVIPVPLQQDPVPVPVPSVPVPVAVPVPPAATQMPATVHLPVPAEQFPGREQERYTAPSPNIPPAPEQTYVPAPAYTSEGPVASPRPDDEPPARVPFGPAIAERISRLEVQAAMGETPPAALAPVIVVPEEETKKQKKAREKRQTKQGAGAGGRGSLLLFRGAIWVVMGFIVLLGTVRLITPPPSTERLADAVKVELQRGNFPVELGEQVGSRFASVYLNLTASTSRQRDDELKTFFTSGFADTLRPLSVPNGSFEQKIVEGPYLAQLPELLDDTRMAFTFAAKVTTSFTPDGSETPTLTTQWVYLEVPVAADEFGGVAIAGPPAFVPAPPPAVKIEPLDPDVDKVASEQATETINDYLKAWAASTSSTPVPAQYLRESSSYQAKVGLAGSVTLEGKPLIEIEKVEDPSAVNRTANVSVLWASSDGLRYNQQYRLALELIDGYWYILDIRGASFTVIR
jgi:hypothetical protein